MPQLNIRDVTLLLTMQGLQLNYSGFNRLASQERELRQFWYPAISASSAHPKQNVEVGAIVDVPFHLG